MKNPRLQLWIVSLVFLVGGCSSRDSSDLLPTSILPATAVRVTDVNADLGAAFKKSEGTVLFRSWNGRWKGTDSDTDIELREGGNAVCTEYGVGIWRHEGTFEISTDHEYPEITIRLDGDTIGDPKPLWLFRDGPDLLLIPNAIYPHVSDWERSRYLFRKIPGETSSREN
ncbi:MAG: hypothetical protein KDB27_13190 [Planctomycetales bacterium]|nr:hypothetical protein [Planctomycetales bacterium]